MSAEERFQKKVDEDWKAAMRREKQKLQTTQKSAEAQSEAKAAETDNVFVGFVNQLVGQTMMDLGAVPNPMTGAREVNLDQARQMIEIVRAIDRKSKKNQSKDEQEFFRQVLSELQMLYVQVAQASGQSTAPAGGVDAAGAPEAPANRAGGPAPGGGRGTTGGAIPGTGRKRR